MVIQPYNVITALLFTSHNMVCLNLRLLQVKEVFVAFVVLFVVIVFH